MQMYGLWRGKVVGVVSERQQLPVSAATYRAAVGARSVHILLTANSVPNFAYPLLSSSRKDLIKMPPTKPGKKATTQKKEKLFHPQSRKAEQLMRVQQRKSKLADLAKARIDKQRTQGQLHFREHRTYKQTYVNSLADIFSFFYHALPEEGVLSLDALHAIVRDVWLKRFDEDLEEEKKSRRKGRPKSTREQKIEELKLQEGELYRTGMGE